MQLPCQINTHGKLIDKQVGIGSFTAAGRIRLSQTMGMPIRRRLDYCGIARKCFAVQELPQGALPTYDRDIDVASVVTAAPTNKIKGERVVVPQFEIFSNPTVHISSVTKRRFNVIDRGLNKLRITSRGKLAGSIVKPVRKSLPYQGIALRSSLYSQFPIRQDIEVIPADEPRPLKLGWTVKEITGTAIIYGRRKKLRITSNGKLDEIHWRIK